MESKDNKAPALPPLSFSNGGVAPIPQQRGCAPPQGPKAPDPVSGEGDSRILLPYQRRWLNDRSRFKIWLASRQVGKSFCLALEAVTEALERKCNNLILSASERQSKEVMLKIYSHLRYLSAISEEHLSAQDGTKEEVSLPNGSRIVSLPASPDTVRGFSGNVFLDEFAFHRDAEEIWRAMYPTVTRGYKLRISSTPNGKQNMFYRIWTGGEIASPLSIGSRNDVIARSEATRQSSVWSRHRTDIYDAAGEGLDADMDALKSGILDEQSWAQEFECRFVDEATAFITYEMIASCEDEGATTHPLIPSMEGTADINSPLGRGVGVGDFYLGVDVGRKRDLTVFWLLEKMGDVFRTRMVHVMEKAPFRAQRDFLYGLMDNLYLSCSGLTGASRLDSPIKSGNDAKIIRACIDSTGIGSQLAEEAAECFGSRIEPVAFTAKVKEDMALTLRRRFEERLIRIPKSREIREDLHGVKKSTTASGNIRFDAERTGDGHSDRFWALALALHAECSEPPGKVDYESLIKRARPIDGVPSSPRWPAGTAGCW